jgi:hypothetical protein
MRFEPSRLAGLVIAYYETFGRHVPEAALRTVKAVELAQKLEEAVATGVPLGETGWESASDREYQCAYSPRGCCIDLDEATGRKGPDGNWIH